MNNNAGMEDARLTAEIRDGHWSTGYCQYVSITNDRTETIDGWSIQFQIKGALSSAWNVTYDSEMGDTVFGNLS